MELARLDAWWRTTGRARFLADAANGWLLQRRWFGGKSRAMEKLEVADVAWLAGKPALALVWLNVAYRAGPSDQYFVPLLVEPTTGDWQDALASDAGVRTLVRFMAEQSCIAGSVTGFATAEVDVGTIEGLPVHHNLGEQSNSCVRLGDRFLFKLFRRLQDGPNPDYEMCRYLSREAGYRHVPAILGAMERPLATGEATTLAMLLPWLPNNGNGWEEALRAVRLALLDGGRTDDLLGDYRHAVALLGQRTAELHRALARDAANPSIRPETLTLADVQVVASRVERELRAASSRLGGQSVPSLSMFPFSASQLAGLRKIRCHGDYHLGQVLCVGGDYVILDFEGEPSRALAERRAKHCPLKDVAGMVRSYDYAAMVSLRDVAKEPSDRQCALAAAWSAEAGAAFTTAYRQRLDDVTLAPGDDAAFAELMRLYLLEKALYELDYEINNRPDWVDVPHRGIQRLCTSA